MKTPTLTEGDEPLKQAVFEIQEWFGGSHEDHSKAEVARIITAYTADQAARHSAQLEKALGRVAQLEGALRRAIQHVPANAVDMKEALSKPVSECRTLDFCERILNNR